MEILTATESPASARSYSDWGAILVGTLVASAIAIVLFTFGTAIGLSMVSPYRGESASRWVYAAVLGLWTLWVVVTSFLAGGYIAGRMRRRLHDSSEHEVEVRDGAHGLAVWALGVVFAALLLALGVSGLVGSAARVAGAVQADGRNDPVTYTVDTLFRATGPKASASADDRREVARILTQGTVRGDLDADNRAYLSRLVAARTGLSPAEADKRVDDTIAQAKQAADMARKAGIIAGFGTAAALLLGALAAMWSATLGGRHRDQATELVHLWRWR